MAPLEFIGRSLLERKVCLGGLFNSRCDIPDGPCDEDGCAMPAWSSPAMDWAFELRFGSVATN